MSGKYTADQLFDEIVSFQEITCSKCHKEDTEANSDDWNAANSFFRKGWRRTKENCYCPSCAKKHLKSSPKNSTS